MAAAVVADTGPIVAALRMRDQHHAWARSHLQAMSAPLRTCDAVLSEAFFLIAGDARAEDGLCHWLRSGMLRVDFSSETQLDETLRLFRRYRALPISYADACLVRMAEIDSQAVVFTIDRDFALYRKNGRQIIPLIAPW